ncbi:hypothetical protein BC834DRAFT_373383 [Gloeopeniophorella convolvens]|nr:hypothetical protein BC834DRAFT_373383 [Gloeopeniophorella convolvens]
MRIPSMFALPPFFVGFAMDLYHEWIWCGRGNENDWRVFRRMLELLRFQVLLSKLTFVVPVVTEDQKVATAQAFPHIAVPGVVNLNLVASVGACDVYYVTNGRLSKFKSWTPCQLVCVPTPCNYLKSHNLASLSVWIAFRIINQRCLCRWAYSPC